MYPSLSPFVGALLPPFSPFWSCSNSAGQLLPLGAVLRLMVLRALRLAFSHLGRILLRVSLCISSHASTFSAMMGSKSDHFDVRFGVTTFGQICRRHRFLRAVPTCAKKLATSNQAPNESSVAIKAQPFSFSCVAADTFNLRDDLSHFGSNSGHILCLSHHCPSD
jgi:hypothetical protein